MMAKTFFPPFLILKPQLLLRFDGVRNYIYVSTVLDKEIDQALCLNATKLFSFYSLSDARLQCQHYN
jgi:hypothetical protein